MMKKRNKIYFAVLACLLSATTFAQEPTSKQINQIKRDTCYLYAEATMENADEALSVARELLMQQVQEYIDGQPKLSKAGNVLVKDMGSNSQSLSMMRGPMHRMFVYVKKSNIEMVGNAVTIKNVADVQKVDEIAPAVAVSQPQAEPQVSPRTESQTVAEPTVKETGISNQPLPPDQVAPDPKTEMTTMPTKEENEGKNEKVSLTDMPQWQLNAITSLMECSSINDALTRLKRLKSEYKIKKYGAPQQCPSVHNSYWIVFGNDGKVANVLGPGESQRVGFKDNNHVTLDQYKGMDAIWFNFAK